MTIRSVIGDATRPSTEKNAIIAHVVNTVGAWGSGFVIAVSKRWQEPEAAYRLWAKSKSPDFRLGAAQLVQVEGDVWVANMIAQNGINRRKDGSPPWDAVGLERCLFNVALAATHLDAEVHLPRICCARGGAKWFEIEPIIQKTLGDLDVTTVVYDYPGDKPICPECFDRRAVYSANDELVACPVCS